MGSSTSSSRVNEELKITGAGIDVFSLVVVVASCPWITRMLLGGEDMAIGDLVVR